MSNISSSIFQLGYQYSATRFLWRNSKLCKGVNTRQSLKRMLRNEFDDFVLLWFSSSNFVFTEYDLRETLEALESLRWQMRVAQKFYNIWCRCVRCYENRLERSDGDEIDNYERCFC